MTNDAGALDPCLREPGPARESGVPVVDRWRECRNLPEDHPQKLAEFLHRQMNEEANVMENAARSLVDFADEPWEIRLGLARQCSDEARHVMAYRRALDVRGVPVGAYPVMNFQFKILKAIDTLVGRLAVQNRTFEADGLDAAVFAVADARARGEDDLADMYDAQSADEILHVRFANEWIKRTVRREPRAVMQIAQALTFGSAVFHQVMSDGGTDQAKYPVAEEARRLAGFEEGEVRVAVEQAEARRAEIRDRLGAG